MYCCFLEREKFMKKIDIIDMSPIVLKPLVVEDIELLRQLRNLNDIRKNFVYDKYIDEESQKKWFVNYLEVNNDLMWSVFFKEEWCGAVAVYDIDLEKKEAEFGRIMLCPSIQGAGLGKKIIKGVLDYCKNILNLRRIVLSVKVNNIPAIKSYLDTGFEFIEKKRGYYLMGLYFK